MEKKKNRKISVLVFLLILSGNLISRTLLLNDFNSASVLNKLEGATDRWAASTARCTRSFNYDPSIIFGRTGYSLQLKWETFPGTFCGYYSLFEDADLSEYNYLSFWVKGSVGSEFFKIELHSYTDQGSCYITDYLDGGVTTSWQKVVIPLDAFGQIKDFNSMNKLVFTMEYDQSILNGSATKGTIYFDDIVFGTWEPGCVRVDYYNDKVPVCALGGNIWSGSYGVSSYIYTAYTNNEFISSSSCLQIRYNVASGFTNWATYMHLFGNGGADKMFDMSKYEYLTCYAKSTNPNIEGNGSTTGVKVQITTNDPTSHRWFTRFTTITNSWRKYKFALSSFKSNGIGPAVDPSKIASVTFVCEYIQLPSDRIGCLYIDNVQFEKADYIPDTSPPGRPSAFKCNDYLLEEYEIFETLNVLTVEAESDIIDPTIEGVIFEYSYDGDIWYQIGTDYLTDDSTYSILWNTTDLVDKSSIQIRAYAIDVSGNISDYLMHSSGYIIKDSLLKKPDQKILTPNNDGVNDVLLFLGLKENFEILIFNFKGELIKRLLEKNYWDGKDKNNNLVESGPYIYQVKYLNDMISGTIILVK